MLEIILEFGKNYDPGSTDGRVGVALGRFASLLEKEEILFLCQLFTRKIW